MNEDTIQVQQALNAVAIGGNLGLPPGEYDIDSTLYLVPTKPHGTFHADFKGVVLNNALAPESTLLQVGDAAANLKWHQSVIENLTIRNQGAHNPEGIIGLDIQHFDHGTIRDSVVAVRGYACVRVGQGTCNGLNIRNVNTSGAIYGIHAAGQNNGLTIEKGKIQQHKFPLLIESCSMLHILGPDFSLNENGIQLNRVALADIVAYFERQGSREAFDLSALIDLVDCRHITIRKSWLNCANGSVGDGTHAGYGVRCMGVTGHVTIKDSEFKLAQRAYVDAGDHTENIVIENCTKDEGADWYRGTITPVRGNVIVKENKPQVPHIFLAQSNVLDPVHVSQWDYEEEAEYANGVISLPKTTGPNSRLRATGTTKCRGVRFAVKVRLVDMIAPPEERDSDMACLRLYCYGQGGPHLTTGPCRIGENPVWLVVEDLQADPNTWTVTIEARGLKEPCIIEVLDVRLGSP